VRRRVSEWIANPSAVQVKQWLGKVQVVGLREGAVPALVVRAWLNNLRHSGGNLRRKRATTLMPAEI